MCVCVRVCVCLCNWLGCAVVLRENTRQNQLNKVWPFVLILSAATWGRQMISCKTEACGGTPSWSRISHFPYCPLFARLFCESANMCVLLCAMSHRIDEEVTASFCEDESVLHMALSYDMISSSSCWAPRQNQKLCCPETEGHRTANLSTLGLI